MEVTKTVSKRRLIFLAVPVGILLICILFSLSRRIPPDEGILREQVVEIAAEYLGRNEADGSHRELIDLYNSQEVLPRGYAVTYEDSWCAAFVSVVAI